MYITRTCGCSCHLHHRTCITLHAIPIIALHSQEKCSDMEVKIFRNHKQYYMQVWVLVVVVHHMSSLTMYVSTFDDPCHCRSYK